MNWREKLSAIREALGGLPLPRWLGPISTLTALCLLLALVVLSLRYLQLRRDLADRVPGPEAFASWEDHLATVSLEGERHALIDRLLPQRPRSFLIAVGAMALAFWLLGFLLATDAVAFVTNREWQVQPLYLAAHFITLRLFATAFSRTFMAGISHLDISHALARHRMWLVLGPIGLLVAVAVAFPFCLYDYQVLFLGEAPSAAGRATDVVLLGMWFMEWVLIAFIWVMVVGYMLLAHWAISNHRYRDMIEVVLHERQHRPFLQMSAQGASIILGFWIVNIVYAWSTGAELSDYAGAAITLVLVVIGFLPPLLQLRGRVNWAVREEMARLRRRLDSRLAREAHGSPDNAAASATEGIEERLDEALVMLRISHLERLYGELGQSEAMDIVVKMLVPATTMAWYGYKYYKGMP